MKLSALLAPLVAAKADHETIMQVVLAYEAEQSNALELRREADRERQARKRSRDVTLGHSDRSLTGAGDVRVSDKTQTTDTTSVKKNTHRADLDAFKAVLADGCDLERIESFVKLRRTKRGQLTEHAARLFVTDARACGLSLSAAIDTCISRNWITVKPDWLAKPAARAGPAPPKPKTAADYLLADTMEMLHEHNGYDGSKAGRGPDASEFSGVTVPGAARRVGVFDGGR